MTNSDCFRLMSVFIIVLSVDDVKIIKFEIQYIFIINSKWIAYLYVSLTDYQCRINANYLHFQHIRIKNHL